MNSTCTHLPLSDYESVGLEQLQRLLYSNRTDTKYVFNTRLLPDVFAQLKDGYSILQIEEHRVHPYRTVYFDTPDLGLYRQHHNRKLKRYKIRSRQYALTGTVFNEVKCTTNKRRTVKTRILRDTLDHQLDTTFRNFVAETWPSNPGQFVFSLEVLFNRITLVDKGFTERITIDTGLTYAYHGTAYSIPTLAIVEVKRQRTGGHSDAARLFRRSRMGCSKYCLGIISVHRQVKANNFKPLLRSLDKITRNSSSSPER